ncbi:ADP-ribosylglycohydrolase family protein [Desulfitobacterium sp. PCE1]|uniref:ADP-ribosylglycohydrolase family protein n=1 Tax=Desulfitobacterium sp. PCE1 TaxID=146907 RepID=UPI000377CE4F|nr:ADP-ribosylglycohydrolase family protein [Desulfitobacterium sp. PCE1]
MLGAVVGDIIGSVYEFKNIKSKDFPLFSSHSRFTDDTVLTMATIDSLIHGMPFAEAYRAWFKRYPQAGYGRSFKEWAESGRNEPYYSWGNGSAMRVSPIGFYYKTLDEVLERAKKSAEVTHNHPEGIKGAQATAAAVFLAKRGKTKSELKETIEREFSYNLNEPLEKIRNGYTFDVSCQGSVPQAIRAFLESENFEDAIRNAISIGGDSDTIACITGALAEAYYGHVPHEIKKEAIIYLDDPINALLSNFYRAL